MARSSGERIRFRSEPGDHGSQPVRALRREVFAKTDGIEDGHGIGRRDVPGGPARIKREHDCNEPFDDHGVGIAAKSKYSVLIARGMLGNQPYLGRAAMHARLGISLLILERRERLTEFDDVTVPVLPIIEK